VIDTGKLRHDQTSTSTSRTTCSRDNSSTTSK
jgi:hypothetical protein